MTTIATPRPTVRNLPQRMGDSLITAAVMNRGGSIADVYAVQDTISRLGLGVRLESLPGSPLVRHNPKRGRGPKGTTYLIEL